MTVEEAPNYYLWHPRLRQDGGLVCNVSPGEQGSPPVASDEFMADILGTFRLDATASKMHILAYRSSYHCEPEPVVWEDKWPVNWRIVLLFTPVTKAIPRLRNEYIGTLAFDPAGMDEDRPSLHGCMVVADFETTADADKCRKKLAESRSISELRHKQRAPEPEFERLVLARSLIQEQICLGRFPRKFYETGAKYAVAVENACHAAGGITTFEQRAAERDELFDPAGIE